MYLYNLTINPATAITTAIYGNFSAPKVHEIVASRGKILDLLRPDENGRMQTICSTEVFGVIRALQPFRFPGAQQDYIICGSDSGRIVILQFSREKNQFVKIHQETFGKSGVRRIVPGELLAVDPKGRACMVAALEKQKFVYVLNRDAEARLTISSPLEAHRSHTLTFAITGLDQGFDNPVFAAIELDCSEVDQDPSGEAAAEVQKHLTLYELDLGLNHVVRRYSEPVDNGANMLVAVPGAGDGPGGVLVCAENFVLYRAEGSAELRAVLPRRADLPAERSVLITAAATHKQKNLFFVLLQSEYGDLYKVTLDWEGEVVRDLTVRYFDTIPPATSIAVLRRGFLFAASETGDHTLYQFQGLGDDDAVSSSASTLMEVEEGFQPVFFEPRALTNLESIDEVESLAPILDLKVANLAGEEVAQLYAACGRGARSTLRVLRPGVALTEAAASPLPAAATAVFTVGPGPGSGGDGFIVVSFSSATLVLRVGETVEEAADSGLAGGVSTLAAARLADGSLVQAHPGGLRHVRPDGRANEWRAPGGLRVTRAAANARQVALALAGGELVLFELGAGGQLTEAERRPLGSEVGALALAPIPEGRTRAPLLAVALGDATLRVLGLDPESLLRPLATQALPAPAESVALLAAGAAGGALSLQAGLVNGLLHRVEADPVTGALSDARSRFLGTRPPKLAPVSIAGAPALLALSSRVWLGGAGAGGRWELLPATCAPLDAAAAFSSEACPEGIVGVSGATLRVMVVERPGQRFDCRTAHLRYTPRALLIHPDHAVLLTLEADHAAVGVAVGDDEGPPDTSNGSGVAVPATTADGNDNDDAQEHGGPLPETMRRSSGPEAEEESAVERARIGATTGLPGQWGSCVRVVDPATLATADCIELGGDEAALSAALVRFEGQSAPHLAVGVARGLQFYPTRAQGGGAIHVFRFSADGRRLEHVHTTDLDGIPRALAEFRGRLLAGVGAGVRLFDIGRKRLLRKSELRGLPTAVARLAVSGNRVYVGDAAQSVTYLKYRTSDGSFYAFADDTVPRAVTSLLTLDYDTVAGADRFGNAFVVRLPPELSNQVEEDPTGGKFAGQGGLLGGAPNKVEPVMNFHVGETVTALQRGTLQPGGREVIFYATIMGGLDVLYPLASREDIDFFQHLELHMRAEAPPLLGRDHMAYRSYYFPVKDVADGDLCEQFSQLPADKQRQIAAELDRTPGEVLKKLEDIRNRVI